MMQSIKATISRPTGFSDEPYRNFPVTVIAFVNGKTPDMSRRSGNHEGIHAVCINEDGSFSAYPLSQLQAMEERK